MGGLSPLYFKEGKMKYQFVSRYGDGWSISFGYGKRLNDGDWEKRTKCVFRNAVFETNDDELAQALQNHKYFNVDFHLNTNQKKVENKYGNKADLAGKLNGMKFQQLRSIALKAKGELGDPKVLFKKKKIELIDYLLQNPERTEALM
jgi:hypothetical protein